MNDLDNARQKKLDKATDVIKRAAEELEQIEAAIIERGKECYEHRAEIRRLRAALEGIAEEVPLDKVRKIVSEALNGESGTDH